MNIEAYQPLTKDQNIDLTKEDINFEKEFNENPIVSIYSSDYSELEDKTAFPVETLKQKIALMVSTTPDKIHLKFASILADSIDEDINGDNICTASFVINNNSQQKIVVNFERAGYYQSANLNQEFPYYGASETHIYIYNEAILEKTLLATYDQETEDWNIDNDGVNYSDSLLSHRKSKKEEYITKRNQILDIFNQPNTETANSLDNQVQVIANQFKAEYVKWSTRILNTLPKQDQIAMYPGETQYGLSPLYNQIQDALVSYITNKFLTAGHIPSQNEIQDILKTGLNYYIETYKTGIPMYEKLFQELDQRRLNGRDQQEVYLGRDGVVAYQGRRAINVARQRGLHQNIRTTLKERGVSVDMNPKYLVYPRLFRDELSPKTAKRYLQLEGITKDEDPVFFDTGFKGTIPEKIMEVLGIEYNDSNESEKIQLLSADKDTRKVKGIPETDRRSIIEDIEHQPKTENSAYGLRYNKNGIIEHLSNSTSFEDQFYARLIELAVRRHFWIKEYTNNTQPNFPKSRYTSVGETSNLTSMEQAFKTTLENDGNGNQKK